METLHYDVEAFGEIVGKGGERVKRIRRESGAEVRLEKGDEGTQVDITASTMEQLVQAKTLIQNAVDNIKEEEEKDEAYVMGPKEKCMRIIGKGGETIKHIRQDSGAN